MEGENHESLIEEKEDIETGDQSLELLQKGPITDIEKLKCMAESIEAERRKKLNSKSTEDSETDNEDGPGESPLEESEMSIDDSDFDIAMSIDDSEFGMEEEASEEEVMFPPITQESSLLTEDSNYDELEQIQGQILMDNKKPEEEEKVNSQKISSYENSNEKIFFDNDFTNPNLEFDEEEESIEEEFNKDYASQEHNIDEKSLDQDNYKDYESPNHNVLKSLKEVASKDEESLEEEAFDDEESLNLTPGGFDIGNELLNQLSSKLEERYLLNQTPSDLNEEEGSLIQQSMELNDDEEPWKQSSTSELEKIQLQILVDNIQAAETASAFMDNKSDKKETSHSDNLNQVKKQEAFTWMESETLPQGWKKKKTRKMAFVKELFLSPGEYIFCSRREALKSLVENNAAFEEIDYMRLSLKHEGWKDSANLPEGWKFRRTKLQTYFCTDKGILLKSCDEAFKHIKSEHEAMTEQFLSAFKIQSSKDAARGGWMTSDTVPIGWKVRKAEGKKAKMFFLSPQGIQFSSKVKALQHLIREKYDEEEIRMMRGTILNDKYKEDPSLPVGWMYRKLFSRNQTLILTSFGDVLESFKQVVIYTQNLDIYSAEVIDKLKIFSKPTCTEKFSGAQWEEDATVPKGWKIKSSGGKTLSILDTHGNQFKCRSAALHFWVKNRGSQVLIEEIKKSLVHEGWKANSDLPSGWMFKKNRQNIFLSRKGVVIREGKNAMAYVKRRLAKGYSQSDIEKIQNFIQRSKSRGKSLLWNEDPTLPQDWKMRKLESGKFSFLAPRGGKFQTRKQAYIFMINKDYPKEEVATMRDKLSVEGWEEHELLPDGWIFKIRESYEELVFITPEGMTFRDAKNKVLDFVKSSKNYNETDVDGIEMFYDIEYSRRIAEKYEWSENDENVPEGWKYRISGQNNEKMHFLSPAGRTFSTRLAAYKHMVASESPEKEIEAMRRTFKCEGWFDDELLPHNWMFKVQVSGSRWSINFLSKEGLELTDGHAKVLEFLEATPEYSDDDQQRMEMFYEIQNNKQRKMKYEWLADEEIIPFGWKYRVLEGKKSKLYFLSPDGHEFSSRHAALLHMIVNAYQEEEIEEMRNSLSVEGWKQIDCLPSGWRMKGATEKKFLARNGEIIKGFSAALASIRESDEYDQSDVFNFQKLQREASWSWLEDDETVPYGWKVSSTNSKLNQNLIMSPDGVQFESRIFAFQHLLRADADELEIEDMRENLIHEGWLESPSIPSGWRYRKMSEDLALLSKDGELFEKNLVQEITEFMRRSELNTGDDFKRLIEFINPDVSHTKSNDQMTAEEWVESDSIPKGWRVKLKDGRNYGRPSFMSPDGSIYRSRKVALQSLLGAGCSDEEVAPLRKMLIHEDWKESELLPNNWLYKTAVGKACLLTDTGKEVDSKRAALEALNDSKLNLEKLDMFFEMISAHKQRTKYEWEENNETVPEGWRIRLVEGNSGKSSLLSPNGNAYPSRKNALQSMINMGSPKKDIDAMRSKLVHEGWKRSDLLPQNWVYKIYGAHSLCIITEEGKEVSSKETTIEYMKNSSKPHQSDAFEKMKMFFDMAFAQKRMLRHGWRDDQSIPAGWKINAKSTLMSPEGTSYPNKKMALKSLIKAKKSEKEIDEMRSKMGYDGWKTSEMLPNKWLYKRFGTKTVIVTSEGEETDTKQSTINEMKSHNYPKDDLGRLETFYDMVFAEGRLSSSSWLEDPETLPIGWKYRIVNKSGKSNFLSPEGLSFTNRKAAYQHMIETKYDPKEIDEMRRMLIHESWQCHDLLPSDWMYKSLQYGNGSRKIIHILSGEGTEMKESRLMVTDFMRSLDRYDATDLRKLNRFFDTELGKTPNIKQEKVEWLEESQTLPEGWKIKKECDGKESFLSPDNVVFTSRSQGLKHMLSTVSYTEKQINEMRIFLNFEGWKKHEKLPQHWLFKENAVGSKTPVMLITPEGEVLESLEAGLDFIKSIYDDKDVTKMHQFIREHAQFYKYNLKQEVDVTDLVEHSQKFPDSFSDEDIEFDDEEIENEMAQIKDSNENKLAMKIPLVKQEVITTPPKKLLNRPLSKPDKYTAPSQSVLDTAELDMLLSRGNFTSSLVSQIQSERKRSQRDLDMEELVTVLNEGKFTTDIVDQIMSKMNNPNNNINLNSVVMRENKKRKSEEHEAEVKRFRRRFAI